MRKAGYAWAHGKFSIVKYNLVESKIQLILQKVYIAGNELRRQNWWSKIIWSLCRVLECCYEEENCKNRGVVRRNVYILNSGKDEVFRGWFKVRVRWRNKYDRRPDEELEDDNQSDWIVLAERSQVGSSHLNRRIKSS